VRREVVEKRGLKDWGGARGKGVGLGRTLSSLRFCIASWTLSKKERLRCRGVRSVEAEGAAADGRLKAVEEKALRVRVRIMVGSVGVLLMSCVYWCEGGLGRGREGRERVRLSLSAFVVDSNRWPTTCGDRFDG
jgi:hypothetical protein